MTRPSAADRRLLPEGRLAGPMPYVIAIMMFLTALAAAGGLAMRTAAARLGAGLDRQVTVQVIVGDPAERDRQADAAMRVLGREAGGGPFTASTIARWGRCSARGSAMPGSIATCRSRR